jgi:hypothetical protein
VTVSISARPAHPGAARWNAWVVCVALVGLVALASCGSSKPAYCAARTKLENSLNAAVSLSPTSPVSDLEAQLKKVQTDATTVVTQAKSDFPSQTSAIKITSKPVTLFFKNGTLTGKATATLTVTSATAATITDGKLNAAHGTGGQAHHSVTDTLSGTGNPTAGTYKITYKGTYK